VKTVIHREDAQHKIAVYLMGAIVHGSSVYGFTYLKNIKHGTNIVLESLHRVMVAEYTKKGVLPPHLFLQLDNTTKQNKSRFMLGWMAVLVRWGIFRDVVISFLPVGHTHEDIDQFFSRLAVYLHKNDARSRDEFVECMKRAYKSATKKLSKSFRMKCGARPVGGHIETAANLSDWLDRYLVPKAKLSGIMAYRQFKIYMHEGQAVMQVPTITPPPHAHTAACTT
jgi:hypothetical protein